METLARKILVVWCLSTLLLGAVAEAGATEGDGVRLRRFALLVAANNGGSGRVKLQYAQSDARAMAKVLAELGGVAAEDRVLLFEPTPQALGEAFGKMKASIAAAKKAGVRVEFLFYYSGHSDEQGLLLNGALFSYDDVRKAMGLQPSDVRIAVVDSCASGALTRAKGGKWKAPFTVDESSKVAGHAYLTSSSASEAAQESDKVGGSFFTHYMIAGLRGAADASRDGRITLNEAYQYAFNETLARTEKTSAGAQHPGYEFQLAGAGDLVLTDLRTTSSLLVLPASLEGRIFVRDDSGRLIAEINKTGKQPMSFGLEPGTYSLVVEQGGQFLTGTIVLSTGSQVELNVANLKTVQAEVNRKRGDDPAAEEAAVQPTTEELAAVGTAVEATAAVEPEGPKPFAVAGLTHVPFSASFVPGLSTNANLGDRVLNGFSLNFFIEDAYALSGAEFSGIGSFRRGWAEGFQAAGVFNWVSGPFRGFQASGVFNINVGDTAGFMATTSLNQVMGDMAGFQAATGLNWVNGSMDGFQGAMAMNWVGGQMRGFQGAMALNIAERFQGFQSATLNINTDLLQGVQAGVVNYSGSFEGLQLGVVNVAGKGSGVALGLFNWIGDGLFQPTIFGSDVTPIAIGLKTGTKHFYTMLGFGTDQSKSTPLYSPLFALGGHFNLNKYLFVDLDLMQHMLVDEGGWDDSAYWEEGKVDLMVSGRLMLGVRPFSWLSIVAGPTANLLVSERRDSVGGGWNVWETQKDGVNVAFAPGFMAGIQFEPQMLEMNDWD